MLANDISLFSSISIKELFEITLIFILSLSGGKKSKWGLIMLMSFTVVGMFYLKKANDFQEENFYNGLSKSILRDAHEGENKNINFGLDESIEYFKRNSIMFSRLYGKSQNNFLLNEED